MASPLLFKINRTSSQEPLILSPGILVMAQDQQISILKNSTSMLVLSWCHCLEFQIRVVNPLYHETSPLINFLLPILQRMKFVSDNLRYSEIIHSTMLAS